MKRPLWWFVACIVLGYGLYAMLSGDVEGAPPKIGSSIKWHYRDGSFLHLHHWFLHLMALGLVLVYLVHRNPVTLPAWVIIVAGFLLGGFLQGLSYSDWYRIYYI